MSHTLENRVHYALPLNHSDFEEIRTVHCVCSGGEEVSQYRHSNDGLMIMVKFYDTDPLPSIMNDLSVIDEEDNNWIPPIDPNLP